MSFRNLNGFVFGVLATLLSTTILAQDVGAKLKSAAIEGDVLVVVVQCAPGYHIYPLDGEEANRTELELKPGPKKISGPIVQPPKKHHRKVYEGGYVEEYDYLDGTVIFRAPLGPGDEKGAELVGSIAFDACNDAGCLPRATEEFKVSLVSDKPALPAPGTASAPTAQDGASVKKLDRPKSTEGQDASDPLTFVSITHPVKVAVGKPFDVVVTTRVKPPWHIYGLKSIGGPEQPTAFSAVPVEEGGAIRIKTAGEPKTDKAPKRHGMGAEAYLYFEGTTIFTVPFTVDGGGAAKAEPFHLRVAYQCCTMTGCLPPTELTFELALEVEPGSAAVPASGSVPNPGPVAKPGPDTIPPAPVAPVTPIAPTTKPQQPKTPERTAAAEIASAVLDPAKIQAGEATTLVLTVRAKDGALPLGAGIAAAEVTLSDASVFRTEGAPLIKAVAAGYEVRQLLRHGGEAVDGKKALAGTVVVGGAEAKFSAEVEVSTPLWAFILLAMGFALGSLLTPCVFPLIPVTISYFTKQSERAGGSPFRLGATYAFGIVASFTLIGLVFTLVLGKNGAASFAMHPITQLAIAILFVVFALSLFGAYEIQLPGFVLNMLGSAQGKGGTGGALLMGFLFALTTFTCTAPFVGTLLANAATSGDYFRPVVGMVAFSAVLAAPFFWLSVSPGFAKKLPKAGGWMNEVKVVMGFIELAAALKFLSGYDVEYFNRTVCLLFSVAIFVLCGLYLLGTFRLPHDSPRERTSVTHLMSALGSFVLAVHLASGLDGSPTSGFIDGYLPVVERSKNHLLEEQRLVDRIVEEVGGAAPSADAKAGESVRGKTGLARAFVDDFPGATAEADRLGVPVFIDFTGFT